VLNNRKEFNMKKSNNTAVIASTILSSVVVGATIAWFLFPRKRKKMIHTLKYESYAMSDMLKLKLHGFMEEVKKEIEMACDKTNEFLQMEKAINAKILKITLKISNDFPELYSYLEEMPVTIPYTNDPEINLNNLKKYYNSLEVMLKNYMLTHEKNTDNA